ncbi:zinc-binding dehydrogenase [Variovorax humicola]|uniref:Zinc-binding dehydrogenase n=1 Tax=Variovorax humicola TaxID=1769758 RepID=A0ABU8WA15_9BURK
MIDLDDNRLAVGKRFGVTATVNSSAGDAAQQVMKLTNQHGVDTAIEVVGIPATFLLCQDIPAVFRPVEQARRPVPAPRPARDAGCRCRASKTRSCARRMWSRMPPASSKLPG